MFLSGRILLGLVRCALLAGNCIWLHVERFHIKLQVFVEEVSNSLVLMHPLNI